MYKVLIPVGAFVLVWVAFNARSYFADEGVGSLAGTGSAVPQSVSAKAADRYQGKTDQGLTTQAAGAEQIAVESSVEIAAELSQEDLQAASRFAKWFENSGFQSLLELTELGGAGYTYDEATLQVLAENGDPSGMLLFGRALLESSQEEATMWLERALLENGSTAAAVLLADHHAIKVADLLISIKNNVHIDGTDREVLELYSQLYEDISEVDETADGQPNLNIHLSEQEINEEIFDLATDGLVYLEVAARMGEPAAIQRLETYKQEIGQHIDLIAEEIDDRVSSLLAKSISTPNSQDMRLTDEEYLRQVNSVITTSANPDEVERLLIGGHAEFLVAIGSDL